MRREKKRPDIRYAVSGARQSPCGRAQACVRNVAASVDCSALRSLGKMHVRNKCQIGMQAGGEERISPPRWRVRWLEDCQHQVSIGLPPGPMNGSICVAAAVATQSKAVQAGLPGCRRRTLVEERLSERLSMPAPVSRAWGGDI